MEMKIPDAPMPWNARPKMRTSIEGATPQIREPISKRIIHVRYTHFEGAMVSICPKVSINPA